VDVGVYLRRAYVRVAEHGLDSPQVGAVVQQVGGKGVAQDVGADLGGLDASLQRVSFDELPDALARQRLAGPADEKRVAFGIH